MAPASLGEKLDTIITDVSALRTSQALTSQAVGELSGHVVDLRGDVREIRDRLTAAETRLSERTRPIRTGAESDPPPSRRRSRARTAGILGGAGVGAAGVAWLVVELVAKLLQ